MENSSGGSAKNRAGKHTIYGVLCGLIAYSITGSIGLFLLLNCWPAYAIASKDKSYTFEMLLLRLLAGLLAAVLAGISVARIANNREKSAWLAGIIVLAVASYIHFFRVWADYPRWYHMAYLLPVVPVISLSNYLFSKRK
jgi:ABC-type multidrug transport system permease subunit